jgi:hypothetical protein
LGLLRELGFRQGVIEHLQARKSARLPSLLRRRDFRGGHSERSLTLWKDIARIVPKIR